MSTPVRPRRERPEADWDLVFKRNPVERIKHDKAPLGIRDALPALIAAGYEAVPEEDIVRLQWWGLYHDKPKSARSCCASAAGRVRRTGKAAGDRRGLNRFGKGVGELATRQNVQLHHLALESLPDVFAHLDAAGITTAGGCGDTVRNITGSPVQGIDPLELFDCTDVIQEAADFFYGNPDFSNLPRKHKYSIAATPDRDNAPEINCIALVGALHEGQEGFGVLVGGGLSSVPRIARELGVFVPKDEAVEVLAAITGAWAADLNYRVSRVKARLKFMIDDIGPEGMRERVEERLGRTLADFDLPAPELASRDHLGVHAQKQPGLSYIGVPVHLGLISGDQMIGVAGIAERAGADVRITRQQNFIVANVPDGQVDAVVAELGEIGLSLAVNHVRGRSIGCTGEPHCNFSVTETKQRLGRLIEHLEARFGDAISSLGLHSSMAARMPVRSTGSPISASRARQRAMPTASACRPTTSSCAAAWRRMRRSARRCSAASRASSSTRQSQDSSRAGSTAARARTRRSPCSRAAGATRSSASRPGSSPSRDACARRRNEYRAVR